jgi:hypothetical protein
MRLRWGSEVIKRKIALLLSILKKIFDGFKFPCTRPNLSISNARDSSAKINNRNHYFQILESFISLPI